MNVLASLTETTGNYVTSRCIASHLTLRHEVTLVDSSGTSKETLGTLAALRARSAFVLREEIQAIAEPL